MRRSGEKPKRRSRSLKGGEAQVAATRFNPGLAAFVQAARALLRIRPLEGSYRAGERGTSCPEGAESWASAGEARSQQKSRVTRKKVKAAGGDRDRRLH